MADVNTRIQTARAILSDISEQQGWTETATFERFRKFVKAVRSWSAAEQEIDTLETKIVASGLGSDNEDPYAIVRELFNLEKVAELHDVIMDHVDNWDSWVQYSGDSAGLSLRGTHLWHLVTFHDAPLLSDHSGTQINELASWLWARTEQLAEEVDSTRPLPRRASAAKLLKRVGDREDAFRSSLKNDGDIHDTRRAIADALGDKPWQRRLNELKPIEADLRRVNLLVDISHLAHKEVRVPLEAFARYGATETGKEKLATLDVAVNDPELAAVVITEIADAVELRAAFVQSATGHSLT